MATISGTGTSVIDYLWLGFDFESESFKKLQSRKPGDGGINPGHLCFVDAWEKFAGMPLSEIQKAQGWDREPDSHNLGGPCIVALVNAAQLTKQKNVKVKYFGGIGDDDTGKRILSILNKTPVDTTNYRVLPGASSPFCIALSDRNYNHGHGERCFAINIGAMTQITPDFLGDDFYASDILYFGATALCPALHDSLTQCLRKGKECGRINVVGTVFDHRNEARDPVGRWPMGESDDSFKMMDLLMVDYDEALRISGKKDIKKAMAFFQKMGVKAFTITHGADPLYAWSSGSLFKPMPVSQFPIIAKVTEDLRANPSQAGDTTGCGDNFAGGVLAYLGECVAKGMKPGQFDMKQAVAWGSASGGFACFTVGGTYLEKKDGEKRAKVDYYRQQYIKQLTQAKL